jgi:hypothetical protein
MTLTGWIFMGTSLSFVIGLTVFCFWRVLRAPDPKSELHAPLDIDTRDLGEE